MTEAIKKNSINIGIILGVIWILCHVIMYSIDLKYFINFWLGLGLIFFGVIIAIVAVVKSKVLKGGFMTFRQAFTAFFITVALAFAIQVAFDSILFNLIDPAAKEIVKEHYIDFNISMGQRAQLPAEKIKEQVEVIKNSNMYGFANLAQQYVFIMLLYTIIGLIVAAAFKKTPTHEQ